MRDKVQNAPGRHRFRMICTFVGGGALTFGMSRDPVESEIYDLFHEGWM